MEIKNILIGIGVIGAGIIGANALANSSQKNSNISGSPVSSIPAVNYNLDFAGLLGDDKVASPSEAFQETSILSTKKDASTSQSSMASGYSSINSGNPISNIFNKVSSTSPDRFAFNSSNGGIIDLSTQQSITQKEYKKRLENPIFTKKFGVQ